MSRKNFSPKKNKRSGAPNVQRIRVDEPAALLAFLFARLSGYSKTFVKTLLKNRQIRVNGQAVSQFDHPLQPGDAVEVDYDRRPAAFRHPMLDIVWEDDYLIVVNKKSGLLSMATDRERERTAYRLLSDYVKKCRPENRIFILHRLDRDTSGLMMFAKDRETQRCLQENWNEAVTERTYLAVAEGRPEKNTDLLVSNLSENAGLKVYVTADGSGREAVTRYRVLESNGRYSLLRLDLETGRKNQIRAQLEAIGHPVAGDPKYGASSSPAGRLMLHAATLGFRHPVTGESCRFEAPAPAVFRAVVRKKEPEVGK